MRPHTVKALELMLFEATTIYASSVSATSRKSLRILTRGLHVRYQVRNQGEVYLETTSPDDAAEAYNNLP